MKFINFRNLIIVVDLLKHSNAYILFSVTFYINMGSYIKSFPIICIF